MSFLGAVNALGTIQTSNKITAVFPNAETKVSGDGWSDCAKKGLAVKTRKGDALLFFRCAPLLKKFETQHAMLKNCAFSLQPDGEVDYTSLHGSCPTLKGEKWSATKWIHIGAFGQSSALQRAKWCGFLSARPACVCLRTFT